jgi:hypothetical protein
VSVHFAGIWLVAVKMFSHLIHFKKSFYKFCTFNAVCKDKAAINYITIQHKNVSFPSNLTGHTTLVYTITYIVPVLFCRKRSGGTLRLFPAIVTYFDDLFYILKTKCRHCAGAYRHKKSAV